MSKPSWDELHPKKIKTKNKKILISTAKTTGQTLDGMFQLCVGCEHPIEKISHCNYIRCPLCKTEWCWVCHKIKGGNLGCHNKEHKSH